MVTQDKDISCVKCGQTIQDGQPFRWLDRQGKCCTHIACEKVDLRAIIRDGVTALEMAQNAGTFVPPIMVAWIAKAKEVLK